MIGHDPRPHNDRGRREICHNLWDDYPEISFDSDLVGKISWQPQPLIRCPPPMRFSTPSTAVTFAATLALTLLLQACGQSDTASLTGAAPAAEAPAAPAEPAVAAAPAVAATYQDLQGNPVEITDYPGKKVFVNYWATWCAPCIKEIPSISRAADTLAAENFVFLLASDESLETINEFLLDRDFTGNFVKLNSYVGSLGIDVMPTSVLYDAAGAPVRTWQGSFEWDSAEMLAELRAQ